MAEDVVDEGESEGEDSQNSGFDSEGLSDADVFRDEDEHIFEVAAAEDISTQRGEPAGEFVAEHVGSGFLGCVSWLSSVMIRLDRSAFVRSFSR